MAEEENQLVCKIPKKQSLYLPNVVHFYFGNIVTFFKKVWRINTMNFEELQIIYFGIL